jgi:hypothetical protein
MEVTQGAAHSIKVPPPPKESTDTSSSVPEAEIPSEAPAEAPPDAPAEAESETSEPPPEKQPPDPNQPIQTEDAEEPSYDREISVANRSIQADDNETFTDDIVQIAEYFRERVSVLYDCNVKDLTLKFGVKDDGHLIYLLSGTVCTTTNGFSSNLMEHIPNGDTEFTEFLTAELSAPPQTGNLCITGAKTCSNADYCCPRLFVILYRALQRFPGINEARLYRVIKARVRAVNPDMIDERVNVCISCLHLYTAEQRIYQGRKLANRLPRTVDPPLFEALTTAELSLKGKRDVGLTMHSHDPYCYVINLRHSPYDKTALPIVPPPTRPFLKPAGPIPKAEPWVDRLYHSQVTRSIKTVDLDRNPFVRKYYDAEVPVIPPSRATFSQEQAPPLYRDRPFTYGFLEKVRLRANRNLKLVQRSSLK